MRLKTLLITSCCCFSLAAEEIPYEKEKMHFKQEEIPFPQIPFLSLRDVINETLKYQWSIQTSELTIQEQEGLLLQATGAFNPLLVTNWSKFFQRDIQNPLGTKTDFNGRTTDTTVSLQTLARLGTTYSINFTNSNVHNPTFLPNPTDASTIGASISQPLLRNLVWSPQTTNEKVQKLQVKAAKLQNVENIASSLVNSLTAYWEYVAAKINLDILINIEKRFCELAQYADELVEEKQQGYATVYQPHADLHLATANRIQGEQNVKSAFNALLLNMGFIPDDLQAIPEFEVQPFPDFNAFCGLDREWFDKLLDRLPSQRADIVAAEVQIRAADLNLKSAKNSLLPEVNLIGIANFFNSGARNRGKHVFESSNFHSPEKDYTVGINFSFPTFNDTAKGLVKQDRALKNQAIVNKNLLEAQVISGFKTSYTFYNALLAEVKKTQLAAEEYQKTVETEKLKLERGLSTYFVVLTLENNWLNAQLQAVLAQKLFAENLLQLRLLSGTLVRWTKRGKIKAIEDPLQFPNMENTPCYPIQCFIDEYCDVETDY